MQTKAARIGASFMMAQAVYALVLALLWILMTEVMFVSIYAGYTGQPLSEALASGSKPAGLWLLTQRMVGVMLFPTSLLMVFLARQSYSKGKRWSWYALLIAGAFTWGGLLGYKIAAGYFRPNPSSMTFIIGAILFIIGIVLPAKAILRRAE